MSKQYDDYLVEHISYVQKAGEWMISHGIVPYDRFDLRNELNNELLDHDKSKRDPYEYEAYDDYFYGNDEDKDVAKDCFNYAWLHHIHNNPHHWQYWLLHEDEGKIVALEIPEVHVYHMIADWWSFSWKNGDLNEVFEWYDKHKTKMILHANTRKLVETILEKIKNLIN